MEWLIGYVKNKGWIVGIGTSIPQIKFKYSFEGKPELFKADDYRLHNLEQNIVGWESGDSIVWLSNEIN